ncbi:HK97 gp10 family phage protein [Halomonas aquamarina]|uniref:HK97 gp10 family phage protein n=1 Tax=Vreelandella aquamarina TaxID=77097 RepID=A0ACC5VYU8_9GAMM|nr:HK97-gp10 family putative phage morphogenesis protein [Halomonas aquamarina]MBZ5489145.1 HK97 gp10 family phage protein [Halomonas aquamarina]
MTDPVALNVEGLDQLLARMDNINYDLRKKGGRFAMRKAANLIRDKAKENAKQIDDPVSAEDISANIAVRFSPKEFRQTGDLVFRVGVMGGAGGRRKTEAFSGLPGGDTRHWRHIEFGRDAIRAQGGGILANPQAGEFFGKEVGPAPAQPFMRRSLSESVQAATDEFITQYNRALDRALRKQAREAGA